MLSPVSQRSITMALTFYRCLQLIINESTECVHVNRGNSAIHDHLRRNLQLDVEY